MNRTALKRARLAKGMTLRDVAAGCAERGRKVSFEHIGAVERGERGLGPKTIPVLLEVLELDIKELIPDAA